MSAKAFISIRLVSPVGIGASVTTMPIDTMLRKKINRYLFTASRFWRKNLNIDSPGRRFFPPIIREPGGLDNLLCPVS